MLVVWKPFSQLMIARCACTCAPLRRTEKGRGWPGPGIGRVHEQLLRRIFRPEGNWERLPGPRTGWVYKQVLQVICQPEGKGSDGQDLGSRRALRQPATPRGLPSRGGVCLKSFADSSEPPVLVLASFPKTWLTEFSGKPAYREIRGFACRKKQPQSGALGTANRQPAS